MADSPVGETRAFDTLLVANRGEIACRVIRTARALGLRTVAVYSDADAGARHVTEADVAVRLGPPPARESYLDADAVLAAAAATGAGAVHPGYGFLSENAAFARACAAAGVVFVGPPPHAVEVMGDKITAKRTVAAAGVPVVPGVDEPGLDDAALVAAAGRVGFPLLVKPSAGGGGKGMHRVDSAGELPGALAAARREAAAAFGDDTLFLERFVTAPRHIEVQVLADSRGSVVHLGERECSLQRRHQKVVEEAPSPLIDAATRARIGAAAVAVARAVGYVGAGTVEFIVSAAAPEEFFFLEMNTRLQVEHPVTECVTGLDLVAAQLRVAAGEALGFGQDDVVLRGHAVEARVYAEDPAAGFLPTGGRVLAYTEPAGDGVRVDSGIRAGQVVPSVYDPMLAKVIGFGEDRASALGRLDEALARMTVLGVGTNIAFLRALLAHPRVRAGTMDTALIDTAVGDLVGTDVPVAALAAAGLHRLGERAAAGTDPWDTLTGWRLAGPAPARLRLAPAGRGGDAAVDVAVSPGRVEVGGVAHPASLHHDLLSLDGVSRRVTVARDGPVVWVGLDGGAWALVDAPRRATRGGREHAETEVRSPMPGTVAAVTAADGDLVSAGAPVVVVEAMKMEHALAAPADGRLRLLVSPGQTVAVGEVLARVEEAS